MLKLKADPTFKAKVDIGVPGGAPVPVEFTFRHRTQDQLKEWLEKSAETADVDYVMECVLGWELNETFTRDNVEIFLQHYFSAAAAIAGAYLRELGQARLKN